MKFMEAPAVGTEVPIAKFPEPETLIDFEDLPFLDSVPEYIFKGSTNKQRFINNSKQE